MRGTVKSLGIVGCGAVSHLLVGRWVNSPWLMPDLTLVGMMLAMGRFPEQAWRIAGLSGWFAMIGSVRQPGLVGFAYAGAGGLARWIATRWDVSRPAVQLLAVGLTEGFILIVTLCVESTRSPLVQAGLRLTPALCGLSLVKVLTTVASFFLIRRVIEG